MNHNLPTPVPATDHTELLSAAADAYDAGKRVRKEAAKAAQANGAKYREIAKALRCSPNRAYTLVNEDVAA